MSDLTTLPEIIKGINNNNVLLPHFQREYVWNKTQQKNLILSVLTGLPSSSSLILEKQDQDNYKCLKIGMRNDIVKDFGPGVCYYLLDGQQRYTTLFYAFYNIFKYDKGKNQTEYERLNSKLRKRWYISFQNNRDTALNYENLIFNKNSLENLLPEDLLNFIYFEELKQQDLKGCEKNLENIEHFCKQKKLLPLFLLIGEENKVLAKRILKKIFDDRLDEIKSRKENIELLGQILKSQGYKNIKESVNEFYKKNESTTQKIETFIDEKGYKDAWVDGIFDHFYYGLKEYEIKPIIMKNRNKAVKTFEYINTGGTNLSSFDLLCARVNNIDLRQQVIDETQKNFSFYNTDFNVNKNFNLREYFGLLGDNNKYCSVEKKYAEYLSQVLNLLHLKKSKSVLPHDKDFTSSILKTKYSLDELDSDFIEGNYKDAVKIIKKSAALLQVFCSHKNLKSITNYLSLIQIFTFFVYSKEKNLNPSNLKKLIGLYWLNLFTGRYNSHQNDHTITDTQVMYKLLFDEDKNEINRIKERINISLLNVEDFASLELLTTKKCNKSLEDNLFMFIRSIKPKFLDLSSPETVLNLGDDVEIHHIIPLASATTVGESSREIRKDNEHLLNATMNKTPIKKATNKEISSKSINQYSNDLKSFNTVFDYHFINKDWIDLKYLPDEESRIKMVFQARYNGILRELRTKIYEYILDS